MATDATLTMRIDGNLKHEAEEVCADIGMNLSTAMTIFLKRLVRDSAFPFPLTAMPAETRHALAESRDIMAHPEKYKGYTDIDDLMRDLDA